MKSSESTTCQHIHIIYIYIVRTCASSKKMFALAKGVRWHLKANDFAAPSPLPADKVTVGRQSHVTEAR